MVSITPATMLMSGAGGDAALVDVRSIGGLNAEVNRTLSRKICELLNASIGVPKNRVYLNFTDVDAQSWGWNGNTFG